MRIATQINKDVTLGGTSNHGNKKKKPKSTHRKWPTIQDGKCDKSIPDMIFFQAFITDNLLQVFFPMLRQALGRELERGKTL